MVGFIELGYIVFFFIFSPIWATYFADYCEIWHNRGYLGLHVRLISYLSVVHSVSTVILAITNNFLQETIAFYCPTVGF